MVFFLTTCRAIENEGTIANCFKAYVDSDTLHVPVPFQKHGFACQVRRRTLNVRRHRGNRHGDTNQNEQSKADGKGTFHGIPQEQGAGKKVIASPLHESIAKAKRQCACLRKKSAIGGRGQVAP